jgi:hypothetical protein
MRSESVMSMGVLLAVVVYPIIGDCGMAIRALGISLSGPKMGERVLLSHWPTNKVSQAIRTDLGILVLDSAS